MSRIVHLENGSAIHADIIETFDEAVQSDQNLEQGVGTTDFWNFVEADIFLKLASIYSTNYLLDCFNRLADEFELDQAYDRLQVLKKDYLGMEA